MNNIGDTIHLGVAAIDTFILSSDIDLSPDAWLDLGLGGAALFIVFVVIVLIFRHNTKMYDKIDILVDAVSKTTAALVANTISNDKDQEEILRQLRDVASISNDTHRRLMRLETRFHEYRTRKDRQ